MLIQRWQSQSLLYKNLWVGQNLMVYVWLALATSCLVILWLAIYVHRPTLLHYVLRHFPFFCTENIPTGAVFMLQTLICAEPSCTITFLEGFLEKVSVWGERGGRPGEMLEHTPLLHASGEE